MCSTSTTVPRTSNEFSAPENSCFKNVLPAFSTDYPADRNPYQCIYCRSTDNGKNVRLVSCFTQHPATKQFEES